MNKIATDISQSKKLAEILPLESADMEYLTIKEDGLLAASVPFIKVDSEVVDSAYKQVYDRITCWSLAALLDVLPQGIRILKSSTNDTYHCDCPKENIDKWFDNPVDACCEMICKLKEKNLI